MPGKLASTVDWDSLEEALFRLTQADLRAFAEKHRRETFYGFAFDCNSEYGEVGLCANTYELLEAQRHAPDPNAGFFESLSKKLGHTAEPSDGEAEDSRWDLGDWHYQGFNSKAFDREWRRFQSVVTEQCMNEEEDERTFTTPTQSRFMESVCRVLTRLERDGAFDVLQRTPDFATLAMDHDESEASARERLQRIRQSGAL